ncbi:MAG: endonuclease domain-containing protein [Oscillospiraceae bacterium]|nr:endonuclease domain-containing protein [Oscillospiraceae bacterium]
MDRNRNLTPLSQKLRKNQTKEENRLWYQFLRQYPVPFRRQYVIGEYIADFYCHKAMLVVELDGSGHYETEQITKDFVRTKYMESQGLSVLRFTNLDVQKNFPAVCAEIDKIVKERC